MKVLWLLFFSWLCEAAHLESSYFPGYGFSWYNPVCGFACYNSISGATLSCTSTDHSGGHGHGAGPTSPECRAGDTAFLTTLAYCMNITCNADNIPTWRREEFWATKVTGDEAVLPKWDYSRALAEIVDPPTAVFNSSLVLDETVLVSEATLKMQTNFMVMFDYIEMLQARYAFVLVTVGFGTPILFTLLTRLPYMTRVFDKIKPYIVYPSTFGTFHSRPLPFSLGNVPTIGQSLYILMFFILNVILTCVNYHRSQPHPWWFPPKEEILAYIGYRTGHISYALLPLVILFSGRNNFLLWVTNWSYATYMLLHRWIARIFALHAIIHSIVLLLTYQGTGSYPVESVKPYWQWGIVATVLVCAMLVLSQLYFRRLSYEIFLIGHILMAVFVIAGCWYHVILKWGFNFYDNWLYAACAVWFFDRLIRVIRTAKNGIRRAVVTELDADHVRVDIQGVRWPSKPGYVAYAYFPTLNLWRPWENHPFSVNSTTLFRSYKHAITSPSSTVGRDDSSEEQTSEKAPAQTNTTHKEDNTIVGTTGVTLIIKKGTGLTKYLKQGAQLMTLIDGPYPQTPSSDILDCDHVLLIGGGIGITGLVAWIQAHPNVKLAWGVKSSAVALVQEMDVILRNIADKEVLVGERLNIDHLLRREAEAGYAKVGVVVCGPEGMCDDVRAKVAGLGRGSSTVFALEVHSFSW
ncbi:hypothetical protein TWF730_000510 [Orbilia blumenaviensis]|uniref:Ferric oxidoreductase domain-containing protein n=1 Tax=Orbilia blumenaviensis TaxID=1796055 RepID=A0AAV9VP20_9PEZI